MIKTERKTIGEFTFELEQLPAFTALPAFHRFLAIAGPGFPMLAQAFKAMKGEGAEVAADGRAKMLDIIGAGLPDVLMRAKPDEVLELSKVLLETCLVQPKGGKLTRFLDVGDELLRGRLPVLLQLIGWAVRVHFGSFFDVLGAGALKAAPAASSSSSPTT